ncbi:MAG: DUF2497 domain-containing protein [Alphaproteobacteria bacterium]|nr:DUF2497 domain-containing protein [Alphaproteobacteria bacterium]
MSETEQEPSMEEILASIRRIISDDDDQSKTEETQVDPDPAEPDEPIEDQETNQAPSPTDVVDPVAELEVDDDDDDDEVLDLTDMDVADPEPLFEQQAYQVPVPPVAAPEPPPPPSPAPQHNQDKLVSTSQASETIDEFTKLGNKLYEDVKELPIGNGAVTLEELTRELVRPMLKEWLDQHLPITVERLVREEIERLVMQSQRKDPW